MAAVSSFIRRAKALLPRRQSTLAGRWRRRFPRASRGLALIVLLVLAFLGGLSVFLGAVTGSSSGAGLPALRESSRLAATRSALTEAQVALAGYAATYRDRQNAIYPDSPPNDAYGYLPLPDLGSSTNANAGCTGEGCEANRSTSAAGKTFVGRLPWRSLNLPPLKDSDGECLWYIVSGSHQSSQKQTPMNWDTLAQIDIVVADNTERLRSLVTTVHDRPLAVVFSPGRVLSDRGQDRSRSGTDIVEQCGGNYNPANYLDPTLAAALSDSTGNLTTASTPFTGAQFTDTTAVSLAVATQGDIYSQSGKRVSICAKDGTACQLLGNDVGLPVTSAAVFAAVRQSSQFRDAGINTLLNRIATCLRDPIEAEKTTTGYLQFASPNGSSGSVRLGKLGDKPLQSTCAYGDATDPIGYFSNYRDQLFLATCNPTCSSVTIDGTANTNCAGALIFSNQRNKNQTRATDTERSSFANYLEGDNLASFNSYGTAYSGISKLKSVSEQAIDQDIVTCIPSGASITTVGSPNLSASFAGITSLANYDAGSQTLTLGATGVSLTSTNTNAAALFSCAWSSDAKPRGNGFRTYFRVRVNNVGDGFTFAVMDAAQNADFINRCGAARQHLGYSGDNGATQPIKPPKIAIEFDTTRNAGFNDTATANYFTSGRNDPCYRSSCPTPNNGMANDAHVAILYWGYQEGTIYTSYPERDDNAHSRPNRNDPSDRPVPWNATPASVYSFPPAYPPPSIRPLDRLRSTTEVERDFHVRIEMIPQAQSAADITAKRREWRIEAWIEPTFVKAITAISWARDLDPVTGNLKNSGTATVTAAGHDLAVGNTVLVRDGPTGFNGDHVVTASNTSAGTFQFAIYPDPGSTSLPGSPKLPVAMRLTDQAKRMRTTSQSIAAQTPVVKYGACTSDANCASGQSCAGADGAGNRYCYSGHQPTIYDKQYIYDIQLANGSYQEALATLRTGFTIGTGSNDQVIIINEQFTEWLP